MFIIGPGANVGCGLPWPQSRANQNALDSGANFPRTQALLVVRLRAWCPSTSSLPSGLKTLMANVAMSNPFVRLAGLLGLAALPLAGCSSGGGPSPLTLPPAGALPQVPSGAAQSPPPPDEAGAPAEAGASIAAILPAVQLPKGVARPVGPPTEIYTRVARGILSCWFGANGPLKPDYVYHAEADPPSKGGGAVIDIRVRDKQMTDPRSIRAWRVAIAQGPEGPSLDIQNFKLPEPYAERLQSDVWRWAASEEGCGPPPPSVSSAAAASVANGPGAARAAVQPAQPAQR